MRAKEKTYSIFTGGEIMKYSLNSNVKHCRNIAILLSFALMLLCFGGCGKEEELKIDPIAAADVYETEDSKIMSMDLLHVTEQVTQKDIDHTMEYIEKTKKGEMKKREPLSVIARGDGKYGIIDGNKTCSALKQLGAKNVPVVVVDKPYQKEAENFDELMSVNSEAESEFQQLAASLGEELKAEVKDCSYLKDTDEIHRQAKEIYGGDYGKLCDVLSADLTVPKDEMKKAKEKLTEKYYVVCFNSDQKDEEFPAYVMLSNSTIAKVRLIGKD